jgi:hypothetical protein
MAKCRRVHTRRVARWREERVRLRWREEMLFEGGFVYALLKLRRRVHALLRLLSIASLCLPASASPASIYI